MFRVPRSFLTAIVVVILLLCAPFFVGMQVENMLTQQIEQLQKNPIIATRIVSYDRGWFESKAVVSMGFSESYMALLKGQMPAKGGDKDGQDAQGTAWMESSFEQDLKIHHGPIMFHDGLGLGVSDIRGNIELAEDSEFVEFTGVRDVFTVQAKTGFTGVTAVVGTVPVITNDLINFKGLSLTGDVRLADSSGDYTFDMPGLDFNNEEGNASIGVVEGKGNFRYLNQFVALGEGEVLVNQISVEQKGEPVFELSNLGLNYRTDTQGGDLLEGEFVYAFEKLVAQEVQLDKFHFGLSFRNLSIAFGEMYMDFYQEILAAGTAASEAEVKMMDRVGKLVYEIAKHSVVIAIDDLHFDYQGETVSATASVTVAGDKLPAEDAFSLMDIAMWQRLIEASAEITLPEAMALQLAEQTMRSQLGELQAQNPAMTDEDVDQMVNAQVPGMLVGLVQQGMITQDESGYHSTASYKEGVLRVNGVPMM